MTENIKTFYGEIEVEGMPFCNGCKEAVLEIDCFFEQSGTFKNEFKKLGYDAEDYDIQNNFGETDHVIDLFAEIDNAYNGKPSLFDSIKTDDLIIAFYPCIYFCEFSQCALRYSRRILRVFHCSTQ